MVKPGRFPSATAGMAGNARFSFGSPCRRALMCIKGTGGLFDIEREAVDGVWHRMADSTQQQKGTMPGFGGFRRPAGLRIPGRLACRRSRRRDHLGGLRDSGFARLCRACGLAAAGRHLRLSARRARLCPARLVAPARHRAHLRDLADDRRDGRRHGGRRRATLRADRQPRGLHGGGAQPVRLAVAAERAGEADQRQHPGRLQGRRRPDHRHDAAAEPVRREGRRPQFLRTGVRCSPGSSARCSTSFSSSGVVAILLLVLGERLLPGKPVALGVVALSIVAATLLGLPALGVPTTGEIPAGLPSLAGPALRLRDVEGIVPLAAGCLLLAYIEGVSAARTFAAKHGYALDPRQELLGIGAANLAAALGQGYPVAGGLSQSAVNDKAGARTPLALVFASITLALCLLFLTGLLENLPKAVLAAVVLTAVYGLLDFPALLRMWRVSRLDFIAATIALVGVLLLGILQGILLAALASILLLLARVSRPHVAFLGRVPGTDSYSDIDRHPENEPLPGVIAFRPEASLIYVNADAVLESVLNRLRDVRLRPPSVWSSAISPLRRISISQARACCTSCMPNLPAAALRCASSAPTERCAICCEPRASRKRSADSIVP